MHLIYKYSSTGLINSIIQKHAFFLVIYDCIKRREKAFHPSTLNKFPLSDLSISLGGDYFQFQHNFSQHSIPN